jgi:predicted transcriptional regulator
LLTLAARSDEIELVQIRPDGDAMMSHSAKDEAKRLIDELPENATLNDIMYELYVKQKIEAGLQAVKEGRTIPHEEVKRRLLNRAD